MYYNTHPFTICNPYCSIAISSKPSIDTESHCHHMYVNVTSQHDRTLSVYTRHIYATYPEVVFLDQTSNIWCTSIQPSYVFARIINRCLQRPNETYSTEAASTRHTKLMLMILKLIYYIAKRSGKYTNSQWIFDSRETRRGKSLLYIGDSWFYIGGNVPKSQSHAVLIRWFLIIIVIYDICLCAVFWGFRVVCHSRIFAIEVIYRTRDFPGNGRHTAGLNNADMVISTFGRYSLFLFVEMVVSILGRGEFTIMQGHSMRQQMHINAAIAIRVMRTICLVLRSVWVDVWAKGSSFEMYGGLDVSKVKIFMVM